MDWIRGLQQLAVNGAGIWTLVLLMIVGLIKIWPSISKLNLERDTSLRRDLLAEISTLKSELRDERRDCERRIALVEAQDREKDKTIEALQAQFIALQIALARNGLALPLATDTNNPAIDAMVSKLLPLLYKGRLAGAEENGTDGEGELPKGA